jgi:hypothetical protein
MPDELATDSVGYTGKPLWSPIQTDTSRYEKGNYEHSTTDIVSLLLSQIFDVAMRYTWYVLSALVHWQI